MDWMGKNIVSYDKSVIFICVEKLTFSTMADVSGTLQVIIINRLNQTHILHIKIFGG